MEGLILFVCSKNMYCVYVILHKILPGGTTDYVGKLDSSEKSLSKVCPPGSIVCRITYPQYIFLAAR